MKKYIKNKLKKKLSKEKNTKVKIIQMKFFTYEKQTKEFYKTNENQQKKCIKKYKGRLINERKKYERIIKTKDTVLKIFLQKKKMLKTNKCSQYFFLKNILAAKII